MTELVYTLNHVSSTMFYNTFSNNNVDYTFTDYEDPFDVMREPLRLLIVDYTGEL
jgi:hypothetical protein